MVIAQYLFNWGPYNFLNDLPLHQDQNLDSFEYIPDFEHRIAKLNIIYLRKKSNIL